MKRIYLFGLAVLSGVLLCLPWQPWCTGFIALIALVPLLFIEQHIRLNKEKNKPRTLFLYSYIAFLIWNLLSTWWIYNSTAGGAIFAIIANAFLTTVVFWLFHLAGRRLGQTAGYIAFVCLWIAWEYFYLDAEITWPWLNLGNGFAKDIHIIQWYEITGSLGGTLWILIINLMVFFLLQSLISGKKITSTIITSIGLVLLITIPVSLSLIRFYSYTEKNNPCNVVVIQPNIDPYNDKFGGMPYEEQMKLMLDLASSKADSSTDLIIGPETALGNNIWINIINRHPTIRHLRQYTARFPHAHYITGLDLLWLYGSRDSITPTARQISQNEWYDSYNSAVLIDTSQIVQIYHKSKLVVGVEMLPYPGLFKFLENMAIDLGGPIGSRGTQDYRGVFYTTDSVVCVAPVICYESVFGEFVTGYINNGANFIAVITNDGWWGNTAGHKQHLSYSQLRAIETRRSIARSANTGISAIINQRGEIVQRAEWWVPAALKASINLNNQRTFYTRHGDFIGRIANFPAIILLLLIIFYKPVLRLFPHKNNSR